MRIVRTPTSWMVLRSCGEREPCLRLLARRCGYRVAELCGELRCSDRYLREVFLRDVGIPPKRWLREDRMSLALRRLNEGGDPGEVAGELGFASCRSFRREFRIWFQMLPRDWGRRSRVGGSLRRRKR